jgi:hypothetical protein
MFAKTGNGIGGFQPKILDPHQLRVKSMFGVIYLFVLVWAALPLARTLMQGPGGNHIEFVRRLYRDAAYILAAVLAIVEVRAGRSALTSVTQGAA